MREQNNTHRLATPRLDGIETTHNAPPEPDNPHCNAMPDRTVGQTTELEHTSATPCLSQTTHNATPELNNT